MKSYSRFIEEWRDNYFSHQRENFVTADDVSDDFIEVLGEESYKAKTKLREFFRKSPHWNEDMQCLILSGEFNQEPDYAQIETLITSIFVCHPAYEILKPGLPFFWTAKPAEEEKYGELLKEAAPKVYKKGKKKSRILAGLCKEFDIWNEEPYFQKLFAQISDELCTKSKKMDVYFSINPGHILSMSNPKYDKRGSTMVSCHSMNSLEYSYNSGCIGYCRDEVTFIAFTVKDKTNPENFYNRKTSRQVFCYEPGNGVLLQSRLYKTKTNSRDASGGTIGYQPESQFFLSLITNEIATLEGLDSDIYGLWVADFYKHSYYNYLSVDCEFSGYEDWDHPEFASKICFLDGLEQNPLYIGESGMNMRTCENSEDIVSSIRCDWCGEYVRYSEDEMIETADGLICPDCIDASFTQCDHCGELHPNERVQEVETTNGYMYLCDHCLENDFAQCERCYTWYNIYEEGAYTVDGHVCDNCLEGNYFYCDKCNEYEPIGRKNHIVLNTGEELDVCDSCLAWAFKQCKHCHKWFRRNNLRESATGGFICDDCFEEHSVLATFSSSGGDFQQYIEKEAARFDSFGNAYHKNYIPENLVECPECGILHEKSEMVELVETESRNLSVCRTCYDAHYQTCPHCNRVLRNERFGTNDKGETVCYDCLNHHKLHQCGKCGCVRSEQNMTKIETEEGEIWVCDSCFKRHEKCIKCGKYHLEVDMVPVSGGSVCHYCYSKYYTRCEHCGQIVLKEDTDEADGQIVCNECLNHGYFKCGICGCWHIRNSHIVDGMHVCNDCFIRYYYICNHCHTWHSLKEPYYAAADGRYICERCHNDGWVICPHCGIEHLVGNPNEEANVPCVHCRQEQYVYCLGCNDYHHKDDFHYISDDGSGICKECYKKGIRACRKCGKIDNVEFLTDTENSYTCSDCLENKYYRCAVCGRSHYPCNFIYVTDDYQGLCDDCYCEGYNVCDDCGKFFKEEELTETIRGNVCHDCLNKHVNQ